MSLFVLLAGVSVALLTGGARAYEGQRMRVARRRVAVRAGMLLGIGLCISTFSASVLEYYAVLLLLLLPCTRLRPRSLALLSAAAVPTVTLYAAWVTENHIEWMRAEVPVGLSVLVQPEHWGGYLFALVSTGGGFQTVYGIPLALAGLAIGRLELRSATVQARMVFGGLGLAVTATIVTVLAPHVMMIGDTTDWRSLFQMPGPYSGYATSAVGITLMIGLALLLLGVLLPVLYRPLPRRLLWPLAATGSMTMTWYAGHFVFLDLIGPRTAFSAVTFLAFIAAVVVLSTVWRSRFRRGPLEWLVHTATVTAAPDHTALAPTGGRASPQRPRSLSS